MIFFLESNVEPPSGGRGGIDSVECADVSRTSTALDTSRYGYQHVVTRLLRLTKVWIGYLHLGLESSLACGFRGTSGRVLGSGRGGGLSLGNAEPHTTAHGFHVVYCWAFSLRYWMKTPRPWTPCQRRQVVGCGVRTLNHSVQLRYTTYFTWAYTGRVCSTFVSANL